MIAKSQLSRFVLSSRAIGAGVIVVYALALGIQTASSSEGSSDSSKDKTNEELLAEMKKKREEKEDKSKKENGDDCTVSEKIDGKYSCSGTEMLMTTQQVTNVVGQTVGTQAVNTYGSLSQQSATTAGTQSAALKASAQTAKIAAEKEIGLGTMNAALGAWQIVNAYSHKSNANELQASGEATSNLKETGAGGASNLTSQNTTVDKMVRDGQFSTVKNAKEAYLKQLQASKANPAAAAAPGGPANPAEGALMKVREEVTKKTDAAESEQRKMFKKAMASGVQAALTGVAEMGNGALQYMAAKEMEKAANSLTNAATGTFTLNMGNIDPGADQLTHGSTAISPGTATDPAVATQDGRLLGGGSPNITPPVNPDAKNPENMGTPDAGKFMAGNPPASAAGQSGGVGVGSTNEAKPEKEDNQPRMADSKSNTSYNTGGGYAAGGGNGSDKGPDLGFLANMLGKKDEEQGKNSILDYGNRSPASAEPYSLLGRDVNLFKRISERMSAKAKSGAIGG